MSLTPRYYETRLTVESSETREETTHTIPIIVNGCGSSSGGGSWRQSVETEQLTSSSLEEKQRFVIRAVRDPRAGGREISLQDAIAAGIIDSARGFFINPVTGEEKAIVIAMTDGDIQVENVTRTQTVGKTEALGLITIRDHVDRHHYTITAVVDALTGEKVDVDEARRRRILDDSEGGSYVIGTTGKKISLDEAIEAGWVTADYDDDIDGQDRHASNVDTKTYAVGAVVDQVRKKKVSFAEAVEHGLIDRETGDYINNQTGERVYVVEAIQLGFLKAHVVKDPTTLDIATENKVVVDRIDKMKTIVSGLGALSSLKMAAAGQKSSPKI